MRSSWISSCPVRRSSWTRAWRRPSLTWRRSCPRKRRKSFSWENVWERKNIEVTMQRQLEIRVKRWSNCASPTSSAPSATSSSSKPPASSAATPSASSASTSGRRSPNHPQIRQTEAGKRHVRYVAQKLWPLHRSRTLTPFWRKPLRFSSPMKPKRVEKNCCRILRRRQTHRQHPVLRLQCPTCRNLITCELFPQLTTDSSRTHHVIDLDVEMRVEIHSLSISTTNDRRNKFEKISSKTKVFDKFVQSRNIVKRLFFVDKPPHTKNISFFSKSK